MPATFRIGVPIVEGTFASDVVHADSRVRRQELAPRAESGGGAPTAPIIIGVIAGIVVLVAVFILLRTVRARHPNPKYIPTPILKKLWTKWTVPVYGGQQYQAPSDDDASSRRDSRMRETADTFDDTSQPGQRSREMHSSRTPSTRVAAGVDRNTSVRSVMTLPAYNQKPGESEQVLGREGERDGIDVVVEMPTAEDEEGLREDEMDALYQIRVARRRQINEREERRRLRREARERNDQVALNELREQAREANGSNTGEIEDLRGEHQRLKEKRQRAVSSVSYADVGVARHDGTRIRANSTESERVGLLSDAASISLSTVGTNNSLGIQHRRDRSSSSVLSIDTAHDEGGPSSPGLTTGDSTYSQPRMGRSRTNSGANTPRLSGSQRAGSSPEIIDAEEGDLGDTSMPPPGYDDVSLDDITPVHSRDRSGANSPYPEPPPDYPGPSQLRNNRLSAHIADLAESATGDEADDRRSSRTSRASGIPQLPSLRLNHLPQIVIEPSSARPRSEEREH